MARSFAMMAGVRSVCAAFGVILVLAAGPAWAVWPPEGFGTVFGSQLKMLELVDAMQSSVLAAREAEKGAVMAETDAESQELAAEARRQDEEVERLRQGARAVIEERGWGKEKTLLDEFDQAWREYRSLDAQILDMAVLNTNLKASRLSQGRGIELLRRLGNALSGLPADPACRVLTSAQMIQILHAPHIAEAEPARMDAIEAEMHSLDAKARSALDELQNAASPNDAGRVKMAMEAYKEYDAVTSMVVADSRKNTNVISLSLSMGKKRTVTARCLELLQAMKETVRRHETTGTR